LAGAQLSVSAVPAAAIAPQQNRLLIPVSQTESAMVRNRVGQNLLWEFRLNISPG